MGGRFGGAAMLPAAGLAKLGCVGVKLVITCFVDVVLARYKAVRWPG